MREVLIITHLSIDTDLDDEELSRWCEKFIVDLRKLEIPKSEILYADINDTVFP
jgi:hypothetical protein